MKVYCGKPCRKSRQKCKQAIAVPANTLLSLSTVCCWEWGGRREGGQSIFPARLQDVTLGTGMGWLVAAKAGQKKSPGTKTALPHTAQHRSSHLEHQQDPEGGRAGREPEPRRKRTQRKMIMKCTEKATENKVLW